MDDYKKMGERLKEIRENTINSEGRKLKQHDLIALCDSILDKTKKNNKSIDANQEEAEQAQKVTRKDGKLIRTDITMAENGNIGQLYLSQVMCLCDALDINIGYIAGEYEADNFTDIKTSEVTGLTLENIKNLRRYNKKKQECKKNGFCLGVNPEYIDILNELMFDEEFIKLVVCINETKKYNYYYKYYCECNKLPKNSINLFLAEREKYEYECTSRYKCNEQLTRLLDHLNK